MTNSSGWADTLAENSERLDWKRGDDVVLWCRPPGPLGHVPDQRLLVAGQPQISRFAGNGPGRGVGVVAIAMADRLPVGVDVVAIRRVVLDVQQRPAAGVST